MIDTEMRDGRFLRYSGRKERICRESQGKCRWCTSSRRVYRFENSLITLACVKSSLVPTSLLNVDGDDESKLKRDWSKDLNVPFGRKIKGECAHSTSRASFHNFLYFCRLSPLKDLWERIRIFFYLSFFSFFSHHSNRGVYMKVCTRRRRRRPSSRFFTEKTLLEDEFVPQKNRGGRSERRSRVRMVGCVLGGLLIPVLPFNTPFLSTE